MRSHKAQHGLSSPWIDAIMVVVVLAVVWIPLLALYGSNPQAPGVVMPTPVPPVISVANLSENTSKTGYVAHAFGEIDGKIYTNSLEAFNLNYSRGYRIFECDLVYLQDGTVLLAHDGHEPLYGLNKPFSETTKDDIASVKENGKYTPLTLDGLVQLARGHPDVRFILDTKNHDIEIIRALVSTAGSNPYLLDQFIPNIWDQAYYDEVMGVHHFRYTILALYRTLAADPGVNEDQLIDMVKKNRITAIAMHKEDDPSMQKLQTGNNAITEPFSISRFQAKLRAAGIPAYVHSIKTPAERDRYRSLGMGVYMDIPLR